MPKTKVRAEGLVKIPAAIATKYCLREGDVLDVRDLNGGIVLIPEKVKRNKKLPKQLNERLWDRMEEEASEAIAKGEVSGPFHQVQDLIAHLRKQRP